jgi:hypothetical protein
MLFYFKGTPSQEEKKLVSASSQHLNQLCLEELAQSKKPCRRKTFSIYHSRTIRILYSTALYRTAAQWG